MSVDKGLIQRLQSQVTGVSSRVYLLSLPNGVAFPAILVRQISSARDTDTRTHSGGKTTVARPRFQVDAYGIDYDALKTISSSVIDALDGFQGVLDSTNILGSALINVTDLSNLETGIYRISHDFEVWHIC